MSKRWMIAASMLAVAGVSGSAMAAGLTRSPGLTSANHSVVIQGYSSALASSVGNLSTANPVNTFTAPFNTGAGSSDASWFTDVPANPGNNTTGWGSSQISSLKWYVGASTPSGSPTITRRIFGASPLPGTSSETYSGNTGTINFASTSGSSSFGFDASIVTQLTDLPTAGQSILVHSLTITRRASVSDPTGTAAAVLSVGAAIDFDILGASTSDVPSIVGTPNNDIRMRVTDGTSYGELYAAAVAGVAPGWGSGLRTTGGFTGTGGMLTSSALSSPGSLTDSTDDVIGAAWFNVPLPQGLGSTISFPIGFSLNVTAIVPEPTSLAVLGATGLLALRRRGR